VALAISLGLQCAAQKYTVFCAICTARQLTMQSAVLAILNPSVCHSVRPSHAGILSK